MENLFALVVVSGLIISAIAVGSWLVRYWNEAIEESKDDGGN